MILKIFLKLALLIFAVAGGRIAYDKGLDLPPFELKHVILTGNWNVNEDSVLAVTGLDKGKSIYKQDLNYAATRLMRQPGIVNCALKRGYFSTITIDVIAAEPALLANFGKLYAISREGIVLPMDSKMPILPLVSGRGIAYAQCYDHLKDPDIAYALEAYDDLMAASPSLCGRLSEINLADNETIRLYFSPAGTEVLIEKRNIENSIKRLAALEKSGIAQDTAVFDLRFGSVMIESAGREGAL